MAMPMTSRETPKITKTTPCHALVAKNISAAPSSTSSTASRRLEDFLVNMLNLNGSSERVPSFHLKHDLLLNHPDRHAVQSHQYRAQDACLLL